MRYSLVPPALKDWVRLLQVQRRYPQADHVWSHRIHATAELGRGCSIAEDVVINRDVKLGDWSYANKGAILFSGSIGTFCSIGHYSQVGPENHPLDYLSSSPALYKSGALVSDDSAWSEWPAPPVIGSDVWIGSHAVILQGVNVGHGAVIAANAVVRKDVEPYTIVGGVPADKIGTRFDVNTIDRLLDLRWWERNDEEIRTELGDAFAAGPRWRDHLSA